MNDKTIALALFASVATTACTHTTKEVRHVRERSRSTAPSESTVVKSYEVPEGSGHAVRDTLRQVFFPGNEAQAPSGRVAVAPDGKVVVAADEAVHRGVAEWLGGMKSLSSAPNSVAVTYWIVRAQPSTESEVDPALAEIRAPLMNASAGLPVSFSPVERVTLRSAHDVRASHEGRTAEVRQTIHRDEQRLMGDLQVEHHGPDGGELRTLVDLPLGAPIVVGEMDGRPDARGARARYLFVVRADEAPES